MGATVVIIDGVRDGLSLLDLEAHLFMCQTQPPSCTLPAIVVCIFAFFFLRRSQDNGLLSFLRVTNQYRFACDRVKAQNYSQFRPDGLQVPFALPIYSLRAYLGTCLEGHSGSCRMSIAKNFPRAKLPPCEACVPWMLASMLGADTTRVP